jgi:hypothetical protein
MTRKSSKESNRTCSDFDRARIAQWGSLEKLAPGA